MIDVSKRDRRDVALLTDSTCVKRCWLCHSHTAAWRGDPGFVAPKRESDKDYHRGIWGRNSNTRLLPPEFIPGWLASILSARTCEQPRTPTTHRFRNEAGRNILYFPSQMRAHGTWPSREPPAQSCCHYKPPIVLPFAEKRR